MGRKTHESIGRVLSGRKNIVISSRKRYKPLVGAFLAHSLKKALSLAGNGEVFIIGGSQLYSETLPFAEKIYLTKVKGEFEGDTFFAEIKKDEWKEISKKTRKADEQNIYPLAWIVLERVKK